MISIQDCIDMCGLTREEIDAIAEHEHIPEIAAAALADYLMHLRRGPEQVREMIRDDIREAVNRGDARHARELLTALHHFLTEHPEGRRVR